VLHLHGLLQGILQCDDGTPFLWMSGSGEQAPRFLIRRDWSTLLRRAMPGLVFALDAI